MRDNRVLCKLLIFGVTENIGDEKEIFTSHIPRVGDMINVEKLLNNEEKEKKKKSGLSSFHCEVRVVFYDFNNLGKLEEVYIRLY